MLLSPVRDTQRKHEDQLKVSDTRRCAKSTDLYIPLLRYLY